MEQPRGEYTNQSKHEGIDAEGEAGGFAEVFRGDAGVEDGIGKTVEVGVDGEPRREGLAGDGACKSPCKGMGGVERGVDAGMEVIEKKGGLHFFEHENVGYAPFADDGGSGGGVGGSISECGGGIGIAWKVFPVEGGDGGNAGGIPEGGGEFRRCENDGRRGIGGRSDGRIGEGRLELRGCSDALEGKAG